jgi:hypothetical protein
MEQIIERAKVLLDGAFSDDDLNTFLIREDGIILLSLGKELSKDVEQTVGSLIGGAFQASMSVLLHSGNSDSPGDLSLSFGNSSSGFYIVPLEVGVQKLFLAMSFSDVANPGKLKNKLKQTARKLAHLEITSEQKSDSDQLFSDITDDEIDNLFSFSGN